MIKDRKVLNRGRLQVSDATGSVRRPPHSGAALIALTVQRYQDALRHALRTGENLERLCTTLGLHTLSPAHLQTIAQRPAAIVPLNVTYYPLNPQATLLTSWLTRLVSALLHADLRARLVEELTVEGSMLLHGVDMDMRLGAPLGGAADRQPDAPGGIVPESLAFWHRGLERLRSWRPAPRTRVLRERWGAWARQRQRRRARQMTRRYMHAVYGHTTINLDHLLSGLLLLQVPHQHRIGVTALKRRVYMVLQTLRADPTLHWHADLTDPELQHRLLTAQRHPGVDSFAQRAVAHHLLTCTETTWEVARERLTTAWPFGAVRLQNFMQVCANEIEPLPAVLRALRQAVRLDLARQRAPLAQALVAYEQQLYDTDYAAFATAGLPRMPPQPVGVGRPLLLPGHGPAGAIGVLLMHGYSASPAEMRPLAHFLHAQGLTVYVVRLRGHGTSPYDLHTRTWQDWYEAVLRGYSCLQAWSRWQFAGGMSTGGGVGPVSGGPRDWTAARRVCGRRAAHAPAALGAPGTRRPDRACFCPGRAGKSRGQLCLPPLAGGAAVAPVYRGLSGDVTTRHPPRLTHPGAWRSDRPPGKRAAYLCPTPVPAQAVALERAQPACDCESARCRRPSGHFQLSPAP